jgi:hypothetical protein
MLELIYKIKSNLSPSTFMERGRACPQKLEKRRRGEA